MKKGRNKRKTRLLTRIPPLLFRTKWSVFLAPILPLGTSRQGRTLFYDQDKIDSPGNIFRQSLAKKNQFGRWVRVDLKTEQDFCCCCCHLQQSAFELSEIRRGQEIWILKDSNVENRNYQWPDNLNKSCVYKNCLPLLSGCKLKVLQITPTS